MRALFARLTRWARRRRGGVSPPPPPGAPSPALVDALTRWLDNEYLARVFSLDP